MQFHRAAKDNTFVRFGSFNQGSITDRLKDPQGRKHLTFKRKKNIYDQKPIYVFKQLGKQQYIRKKLSVLIFCPNSLSDYGFCCYLGVQAWEPPSTRPHGAGREPARCGQAQGIRHVPTTGENQHAMA